MTIEHRPFTPQATPGESAVFVQGDLLLGDDGLDVAAAIRARGAPLVLGYAWSRGDPEAEREAMSAVWGNRSLWHSAPTVGVRPDAGAGRLYQASCFGSAVSTSSIRPL